MSHCEPCLHSLLAKVLNNPVHAQPLPLGLQALLKCPSYIQFECPQFVRAPWVGMLIPSCYSLSPRNCRNTGSLGSFSGAPLGAGTRVLFLQMSRQAAVSPCSSSSPGGPGGSCDSSFGSGIGVFTSAR